MDFKVGDIYVYTSSDESYKFKILAIPGNDHVFIEVLKIYKEVPFIRNMVGAMHYLNINTSGMWKPTIEALVKEDVDSFIKD